MGRNGLLRQIEIQQQNQSLLRGNDSLKNILADMEKQKARLLKDSAYMEEIARTRFGMSRPGESVYRFLAPQDSVPRNASTQPALSEGTRNHGVTVTRPD